MTDLPNIVRERLQTAPAGLHPDPDLLTAFAEEALSDRERTQVLIHLARCTDCRDVVALATPLTPTTAVVGGIDTRLKRKAPWFSWPTLRWGALAACMVIVGTAVLMQRNLEMRSAPLPVQKDANLEARTLREIAPLSSGDTVALLDQNRAPKSDKLSAAKRAATGDEALELKQPLSLPGTQFAKRKKSLNGSLAFSNAPPAKLELRAGVPSALQPPPAPPARPAEARQLPLEGRSAADLTAPSAPGATTETVEVEAMAGPVKTEQAAAEKDEALGKAKPSASAQLGSMVATPPASAPTDKALAKAEARGNLRAEQLYRHRADVARWTISSDGQLQHSVDSGKTWQPVVVAEKATFRALSANGPDLWVGGPAGLLYHSTDAGGQWTQVKPTAAGATLAADIAAIEFTNLQHGKLTTSTGEVWTTNDAGETWRKQP